jgi:septum formation protein
LRLVLASSSPRRIELLERLRLEFTSVSPEIDEARRPGETPGVYVERVAREKALSVVAPDTVVLAADTCVVYGGHVMGKPAHPAEARTMLDTLQGDVHEVFTGIAAAAGDEVRSLVDVTEVRMLAMTEHEIADYIATGEPMGKAGAYALQGAGGEFVEEIRGSPFTVVGLPIHLIPRLLGQVGFVVDRFRITDPV